MAKAKQPATKICKHCSTEIPYGAKVCPNCRRKVKGGKLKWIVLAIVAIGILGAAFGGGDDQDTKEADSVQTQNESADKAEKKQAKKAKPKKIEYHAYDCTQLFDELKANAMKAEKDHQDEYVEVTGYLGTIDSDGGYIGLGASEDNYDYMFQSIQCYMKTDEQKEKVMNLTKGDPITVRGKITQIGEVIGYHLDMTDIN